MIWRLLTGLFYQGIEDGLQRFHYPIHRRNDIAKS